MLSKCTLYFITDNSPTWWFNRMFAKSDFYTNVFMFKCTFPMKYWLLSTLHSPVNERIGEWKNSLRSNFVCNFLHSTWKCCCLKSQQLYKWKCKVCLWETFVQQRWALCCAKCRPIICSKHAHTAQQTSPASTQGCVKQQQFTWIIIFCIQAIIKECVQTASSMIVNSDLTVYKLETWGEKQDVHQFKQNSIPFNTWRQGWINTQTKKINYKII